MMPPCQITGLWGGPREQSRFIVVQLLRGPHAKEPLLGLMLPVAILKF